ncbi:peptidoglycan-binding domain-containing protein [Pimelobacter simplex]|uniref:peptidoglycan-binding domain-containing protein n=1 Tax=Nocardioides simplex TaxID=2045 RepID=UPI00214F97F3|nr:peptidoglycan-binding domain-containing protein [Pimelobacter simplex]UUW96558.1 peptidoglycan-binding protein [Pimelobacter simplex]
MAVHDELADLARSAGAQVLEDADSFRAAVDDFVPEGSITTGELNLLVDAIRMRALGRLVEMLDRDADPTAAIDLHGDQLARDRGTTEAGGARWALAALGFALGRVGDAEVRARHAEMTAAGTVPRPPSVPAPAPPPAPAPAPATELGPAPTLPTLPTEAPLRRRPPPPPSPAAPVAPVTPVAPVAPAAPAAPAARSGRGRLALVVLVVLALLGGGVGVGVLLSGRDKDKDAPTAASASDGTSAPTGSAPRTGSTESTDPTQGSGPTGSTDPAGAESGGTAPDPLGVGYPLRNQPCSDGFIVVLASAEGASPAATVQDALDRFPRAEGRAYLDPARSCRNLSHLTYKVNLARVPYIGPYPDAVAACQARMAVADTTTYVIEVAQDATTATFCACSYDDAALPLLNRVDDSAPRGDNRFWTLELQYMLWEAGYNPQRLVPGKFGSQTAGFVSALQGDNGLDRTGAMDAATWRALKARAC